MRILTCLPKTLKNPIISHPDLKLEINPIELLNIKWGRIKTCWEGALILSLTWTPILLSSLLMVRHSKIWINNKWVLITSLTFYYKISILPKWVNRLIWLRISNFSNFKIRITHTFLSNNPIFNNKIPRIAPTASAVAKLSNNFKTILNNLTLNSWTPM